MLSIYEYECCNEVERESRRINEEFERRRRQLEKEYSIEEANRIFKEENQRFEDTVNYIFNSLFNK